MKIELKEEHISVIKNALEVYCRMRYGQFKIALDQAMLDKHVADYDTMVKIEDDLKKEYFPELVQNGYYGIGSDKEGDIAYEIEALLTQYTSMKNQTEPLGNSWKGFVTRNFDDPLEVSNVELPKIEEDYKHAYLEIKDKDIIEAYESENYRDAWDLIDEAGFPRSNHSEIVKEASKYYLKLKKPFYYERSSRN